MHSSNHIIKFMKNVDKKEHIIVDFRRAQRDHCPLNMDGSSMEVVKSTKFLGVHLVENLSWSLNTSSITKKAQQCHCFLRKLRKARLPPSIITTFYRGTMMSVKRSCIIVLYGNCTVLDHRTLQQIVRTAEMIIGASLPSITDTYHDQRCGGPHAPLTHTLHPAAFWQEPAWPVKKPALTSEDSTRAHHKDGEDSTWWPGGNRNLPFACPTNNQESSMAESKSLEELKIERTTAKRLFSRLTNHIVRTHMDMSVEELQDSFKRLTAEGSKVIDVNEELEAAYITQCEAEGTPELMGQQRADAEKTEKESIKLKATALPKFTGSQREFYRWWKEWEALQKQGEPTRSMEVKKFKLLDSLDDKVAKDLRLSTYTSADEIFRVLENRYGNQATIAIEIIEELQAIPPVHSNQPRRIIELIQAVEKALYDLNELDRANAIKNLLVVKSIESKLPESLKKDWLTHAADPKNAVTHQNRIDKLLAYLQSQESIYEQLDQLRDINPAKERTKFPIKYARTKSKSGPVRAEGRRYTEVQEFISKLSPELAQQCQEAFCNVSRAFNSMAAERGLLEETGLKEYPVILMLLDVIANDGQRIGTLIDLASDTNYITHKAASKLNLHSEDVMLVIQGVRGMKVSVATKRYLLKIRVNTSRGTLKPHQLVCYGLDKIAEVKRHVPPQKLQEIFPDVPLQDLIRPREIQLLVSHKEGQLVPQKIRSIGDLVLWDGPLGKTIGGTHPDLF
ncbi:unnamed protein product [Oreochromis niloticus]|nr:unnamed protein product [Mustela putorius furo]